MGPGLRRDDASCGVFAFNEWPPAPFTTSGEAIQTPSFRDGPQDQTSDVQLHIGESRDSGFDASHRPGMTESGLLRGACHRARIRATRRLHLRADFYGSPLLIYKLPTIITAAAITDATITITATAAITITAAAITIAAATITTAATAPRRRRRRRNPDSTAAAAAAPTGVVVTGATPAAATPSAATPATPTNIRRTIEALGYGVGGNGGSSECEGRRDHGGYPA
jgi:hypothetical protein